MRMILSTAVVAVALAVSPVALAKLQSNNNDEHISLGAGGAITAETFAQQRAQLAEEIESGDAYVEITAMEKREVNQSLDRMQAWLESAGSVDAMSEDQRIRLLNEQEKINTMLTGVAADSRMVCTREQSVGSRMRQTVCFTVAERRRRREADAEGVNRIFVGGLEGDDPTSFRGR